MSSPQPLQNNWEYAMRQDRPRNMMQPATAWNIRDAIINDGAAVRKRGPWRYGSGSLDSGEKIIGGVYATFSSTAGEQSKNLIVANNGNLYNSEYSTTGGGASTLIGDSRVVVQNPVYHGGTALSATTPIYTGLVVIPDGSGLTRPSVYNGTTLTDMSGNPPLARYAAVYKDYTALANGTVGTTYFPNRVWFSPPGDPDCATAATAWDTTFSWIDFSLPVIGMAATKNVMLVFHETYVSRLRGSTPPPDDDMVVDDPLFNVGLLSAFSIATWKEQVLFASPQGVFRTDGVTLDNLALRGGMSRYWLNLMKDNINLEASGGVIRDHYILIIHNDGVFVDGFVIDLTTLAWTRISNVSSTCMWSGLVEGSDELFSGPADSFQIIMLSYIFGDTGSENNDGNGLPVRTLVETSFYPLNKPPGKKRVKRGFVGCETGGATVSYILTPEETNYASTDSLTATTEYSRQIFDVNDEGFGIALKVENTAGDFLLYDLSVETWPIEPSRI